MPHRGDPDVRISPAFDAPAEQVSASQEDIKAGPGIPTPVYGTDFPIRDDPYEAWAIVPHVPLPPAPELESDSEGSASIDSEDDDKYQATGAAAHEVVGMRWKPISMPKLEDDEELETLVSEQVAPDGHHPPAPPPLSPP